MTLLLFYIAIILMIIQSSWADQDGNPAKHPGPATVQAGNRQTRLKHPIHPGPATFQARSPASPRQAQFLFFLAIFYRSGIILVWANFRSGIILVTRLVSSWSPIHAFYYKTNTSHNIWVLPTDLRGPLATWAWAGRLVWLGWVRLAAVRA